VTKDLHIFFNNKISKNFNESKILLRYLNSPILKCIGVSLIYIYIYIYIYILTVIYTTQLIFSEAKIEFENEKWLQKGFHYATSL